MATGDVTWEQYQAYASAFATSLSGGDYVGARTNALMAKSCALGLGDRIAASGTSVDLVCAEWAKLLEEVTILEKHVNMKASSNLRLGKVRLKDEGRDWGGWGRNDGGTLHE